MFSSSHNKRKRQNIDQLLRSDLVFKRSAQKTGADQIEAAVKLATNHLTGRRIVFTESCEYLKVHELVDLSRAIILEGMDGYVGASSGILKGLSFSKSSFVNITPSISTAQQQKTSEISDAVTSDISVNKLGSITAMSFIGTDQMEVLLGRKNAQIDLFSSVNDQVSSLMALPEQSEIKGVHSIDGEKLLTAQECGTLGVWSGSGERKSSKDWNAGDNLLTMQIVPGEAPKLFATGGRENPLKIWDLDEEKCTFVAKNVRPDMLELRVPVWVTCCRFLDTSGKCIVTSTGKSQIRVYDTRAQRRPILEEHWLDEPIQALSRCCREWHVLAGNNRGELGLFDLRATEKSRLASKYKGFSGAIRCIDASSNQPQILSCGIDRFAILHELDSRKVLKKIYCKAQLNCCLICDDNSFNQLKMRKLKR